MPMQKRAEVRKIAAWLLQEKLCDPRNSRLFWIGNS